MSSAPRVALDATYFPLGRSRGKAVPVSPPKRGASLPQPGKHFLAELAKQGSLLIQGAEALVEGDIALLVQLEADAGKAVTAISEQVTRTLITPLDGEDIRNVALLFHRALRIQRKLAMRMPATQLHIPELATANLNAAQALAQAAMWLPQPDVLDMTRHTYQAAREAKRMLREWHAEVLRREPLEVVLRAQQFRHLPLALFDHYLYTARELERMRFKNG